MSVCNTSLCRFATSCDAGLQHRSAPRRAGRQGGGEAAPADECTLGVVGQDLHADVGAYCHTQ